MSEDLNIKNEEAQAENTEHHHHHRHHHRHHHSNHHSNRTSSRHSSHRHGTDRRKSSLFKKIKRFFKKLSRKLTLDTSKYLGGIKKLARSSDSDSRKKYTVISRRVSFGVIITAIVCYSTFTLLSGEEDTIIKNAGYTPSETSILKIQVMELEQKNAQLQRELARYKEKYGELTDE